MFKVKILNHGEVLMGLEDCSGEQTKGMLLEDNDGTIK